MGIRANAIFTQSAGALDQDSTATEIATLRARSAELAWQISVGHDHLMALEERISQDSAEYARHFVPWEQLLREYAQVETRIACLELADERAE